MSLSLSPKLVIPPNYRLHRRWQFNEGAIKSSTHMTLFSVLPGVFVENFLLYRRGRHGHDRMVVGLPVQSVPITTKVVTSNPVRGKVYSIEHYVIKFISDFPHVDDFLQVIRFPPPIKLTATI